MASRQRRPLAILFAAVLLFIISFASPTPLTLFFRYAHAIEMAHVQNDKDTVTRVAFAKVKCGGEITIDSLHPNMPGGSSESSHLPYYPSTTGRAGPQYVHYEMRTVDVGFARLVEDTLHTSITNVILFEVSSADTAVGSNCDVYWDPRGSWVSDVETSSLSVAVLNSQPLSSGGESSPPPPTLGMCADVSMSFSNIGGGAALSVGMAAAVGVNDKALRTSVALNTLNTRFNGDATIDTADTFPATILAPPQCTVIIALIATHYGKYTSMKRWLPLLIYSVLFLPLVAIVGRKGVTKGTNGGIMVLALTFIGYAGSCVGVGIELATWSYPLHPFPFPGSVTMFLLAAISYALVLVFLMWGHTLRLVATHTMFNMLLYGLSVGLMVGYFLRAFLVIGIIAVCLLGLLNFIIIVLTVYFASVLPRSFRLHTGSSHPRSLIMWFPVTAPIVPASYFALQFGWTGLQHGVGWNKYQRNRIQRDRRDILEGYDQQTASAAAMGGEGDAAAAAHGVMPRMAIVNLHSIISSVLFLYFHNLPTIALLIAACIYHTPFVVALFPALILTTIHLAYTMQEYTRAWRKYKSHYGGRGVTPDYSATRKRRGSDADEGDDVLDVDADDSFLCCCTPTCGGGGFKLKGLILSLSDAINFYAKEEAELSAARGGEGGRGGRSGASAEAEAYYHGGGNGRNRSNTPNGDARGQRRGGGGGGSQDGARYLDDSNTMGAANGNEAYPAQGGPHHFPNRNSSANVAAKLNYHPTEEGPMGTFSPRQYQPHHRVSMAEMMASGYGYSNAADYNEVAGGNAASQYDPSMQNPIGALNSGVQMGDYYPNNNANNDYRHRRQASYTEGEGYGSEFGGGMRMDGGGGEEMKVLPSRNGPQRQQQYTATTPRISLGSPSTNVVVGSGGASLAPQQQQPLDYRRSMTTLTTRSDLIAPGAGLGGVGGTGNVSATAQRGQRALSPPSPSPAANMMNTENAYAANYGNVTSAMPPIGRGRGDGPQGINATPPRGISPPTQYKRDSAAGTMMNGKPPTTFRTVASMASASAQQQQRGAQNLTGRSGSAMLMGMQ